MSTCTGRSFPACPSSSFSHCRPTFSSGTAHVGERSTPSATCCPKIGASSTSQSPLAKLTLYSHRRLLTLLTIVPFLSTMQRVLERRLDTPHFSPLAPTDLALRPPPRLHTGNSPSPSHSQRFPSSLPRPPLALTQTPRVLPRRSVPPRPPRATAALQPDHTQRARNGRDPKHARTDRGYVPVKGRATGVCL